MRLSQNENRSLSELLLELQSIILITRFFKLSMALQWDGTADTGGEECSLRLVKKDRNTDWH